MSGALVIYHGGCDDGLAAAAIAKRGLTLQFGSNVTCYSGAYQKEPPDVTNKHVILVDFSYKRPVLEQMIEKAQTLLVLDHHKTAAEDLAFLCQLPKSYNIYARDGSEPRAAALFDMERSGAGIAWDFFNPGHMRPDFVNYIEDRDLWRKKLPMGDEFTIAVRSYPQSVEIFEEWIFGKTGGAVASFLDEGVSIQRYYRCRVEELKKTAYLASFASPTYEKVYDCMIANAPYFAASEVAGELCEYPNAQFGACYFERRPGEYQYSLRSRGDFDVSAIAKWYGGGGHRNAAGFTADQPVHIYG